MGQKSSSSSVRRRFKAVVVSLFLLALSFIRIRYGQQVWKMAGVPSILSPQVTQVQKQQHSSNDNDSCKTLLLQTLLLHEGGHWEHHYYHQQQSLNNTTKELYTSIFNNTTRHYFPQEMDWILSNRSWPDKSWGTCFHLHVSDTQPPYMYQSKLGNQCGSCGVVLGFQPSLSTWVPAHFTNASTSNATTEHNTQIQQPQYDKNVQVMSPSLRLIQRLAESNSTLCLAGDSIDFQFYDALRNNLIRQQSLLRLHKLKGNLFNQIIQNISISESRQIPVNFTNVGLPPYHIYWMTMDHIIETTVTLTYANGSTYTSTFRYFKTYGWSPCK